MTMTDKQIIDLTAELFGGSEIGLYPERHDNGADCYTCPCCGKSTNIKGYAYGMESLDAFGADGHSPDCKLWKLFTAIKERQDEQTGNA